MVGALADFVIVENQEIVDKGHSGENSTAGHNWTVGHDVNTIGENCAVGLARMLGQSVGSVWQSKLVK